MSPCFFGQQPKLGEKPGRTLSADLRACLNPERFPPSSSARTSASLAFCAARCLAFPFVGAGAGFMPSRDGFGFEVEACERVFEEAEGCVPLAAAAGARCRGIV